MPRRNRRAPEPPPVVFQPSRAIRASCETKERYASDAEARSIAKNILTTEAIVAEVPDKDGGGGGGMPDMGGMGGMM